MKSLSGVNNMNSVTANEILEMICYQWAGTKEIMKIGNIGESRALRIKKEISAELVDKGYVLPRNKVPMESVIKHFKINIDFLRRVTEEREMKNG